MTQAAHRPGERATPSPAQERVRSSMEALLARAGLDYRGGFVRVGGRPVHYLDYGPDDPPAADPRPPVLLLHGAGAGSAIWYEQIAALARERRVRAPDHPGFGLSDPWTLGTSIQESMHRYLAGFMDALEIERADVVGLSLGGFAAMILAMAEPRRVRRLTVIDSAGLGRELPWVFRVMGLPLAGRLFAAGAKTLTWPLRLVMSVAFDTSEVAHPERPDAGAMKRYAYDVAVAQSHHMVLQQGAAKIASLGGQKLVLSREDLSRIRAPTLLIWGAKDRFFPLSHAERAHRLIPGSRLVVLPDAGHLVTFDEPERVSSLIAGFLNE